MSIIDPRTGKPVSEKLNSTENDIKNIVKFLQLHEAKLQHQAASIFQLSVLSEYLIDKLNAEVTPLLPEGSKPIFDMSEFYEILKVRGEELDKIIEEQQKAQAKSEQKAS